MEFEKGIGGRLQLYLWLRWMITDNYVSSWWEKYVYLRPRAPIMVKSNYYIIGQGKSPSVNDVPTKVQSARAATLCYGAFKFRYELDMETMEPQAAANVRPTCMAQFERLFNTTRVAKDDEFDEIVHYETNRKLSNHIVVMHKGRYFRLDCYPNNRLLSPAEFQDQFEMILHDESQPQGMVENTGYFF